MYATTANVWLYDCHFDHVRVNSVVEALAQPPGTKIVVPSISLALKVLIAFGHSEEDAEFWVSKAKQREASGVHD